VADRHDVVVAGAGLSGLACALRCAERGLDVVVLEAADRPGGRVRTDVVDGARVDRGFQVFNTAYPEAARLRDYTALRLCPFVPGAAVYRGGHLRRVVNPLRQPAGGALLSGRRAADALARDLAGCRR
jgi:phytoene dehydrogenase-like protein